MQPERLLLTFERSPEESGLRGVDEAVHTLRRNGVDVEVAARHPAENGLFARVLRFWFPYLSSAGVVGVTPGAALGPAAEAGAFIVTLAPSVGPALGAWLQERHGRRIRVRLDGVEIEARNSEQVASLLSRLEALRNRKPAEAEKQ